MPDADILTALESGEATVFWCVYVGLSSPLYLTTFGVETTVDSDTYTPHGMKIQVTRQYLGGTCVVDMDDDGTLEEAEDQDDWRGSDIEVYRVWRLSGGDEVESMYVGTVGEVGFSEGRVRISAGAAETLAVGPATPETDDRCVHVFKGPGCGYSGATATCDGSLTACQAMNGGSNEINRVSAEYAPVPGTVVIWEGTPYYVPASTTGSNVSSTGATISSTGVATGSGTGHTANPPPGEL